MRSAQVPQASWSHEISPLQLQFPALHHDALLHHCLPRRSGSLLFQVHARQKDAPAITKFFCLKTAIKSGAEEVQGQQFSSLN